MGEDGNPKSISHETTFNEDTADLETLESTLLRLSEMVGRRLREHQLYARTVQLKLRYSDFSTITRAHSLDHATQLDTEIFREVRALFREQLQSQSQNPSAGRPCFRIWSRRRANSISWAKTKPIVGEKRSPPMDHIRDKFGEDSVSLATGLKGRFRERVHENPAGLPGKTPRED